MRARALFWVSIAAVTAFALPASAQEHDPLGRGELDRLQLRNFHDFEELHLGELLGEGEWFRFGMNIFGDLQFRALAGDIEPRPAPAFEAGALGLLFNARLGDSVRALVEIPFELDFSGYTRVYIARMWLRWANEHFFVMFGKSHSDLSYWNVMFHHGTWIMPTVDRPRIVEHEYHGGPVPLHWTALQAGATVPLGDTVMQITIGAGNGRGDSPILIQSVVDNNDEKALMLAVHWDDLLVEGLRLGLAVQHDWIAPAPEEIRPLLPDQQITELTTSGHIAYCSTRLMLIAEAIAVRHQADELSWLAYGGYLFGSYRFGDFTPYLRFELDGSENDYENPYFSPDAYYMDDTPGYTHTGVKGEAFLQTDIFESVAGLRMDISSWSNIKLEYRLTSFSETDAIIHTGIANWSFGI